MTSRVSAVSSRASAVTSRAPAVLWAVAALAVLVAIASELTRATVSATSAVELVDAGLPAAVASRAAEYRAGQRQLALGALAIRALVALLALSPFVVRRVAGRVRVVVDARVARGKRVPRAAMAGALAVGVVVATDLALLPVRLVSWRRAVDVGLSTQSLGLWARDTAVVLLPHWGLLFLAVVVTAWLITRRPRDWVPAAGLLLGGGGVLVVLLSPLVFEPLLLNFEPLEDTALRDRIELLADDALGRPPDEVLVADASRRTTASNAYVSGLGGTRRIVLYDTLLADAPAEEVLAIVAHELAHQANGDLARTALQVLGGSVAVVAAVAWIGRHRIRDEAGLRPAAAVPLIGWVLIGSLLLGPVGAWSSRRAEMAADAAALELTGDPDTFVAMMLGLAEANLSDPSPPEWSVALWFTHPPIGQRIGRALQS